SCAFLRGFPAKAMQNYCFFPIPPNFSAYFFKKITKNFIMARLVSFKSTQYITNRLSEATEP
ncbi:MAG: hypothetical protein K2H38_05415, partial [Muribaculaceae bacterium]|nr:hypothetical protein [Muribaculaceae bacterium]